MKQLFFSLSLLLCIFLLKAGWPASTPKFRTTPVASPDIKSRMQKSRISKTHYRLAFDCIYTTLYVDSSTTTSSGDGGSWANAYKELRDALAAAAQCPNVNTILVAKGTYQPTANTNRDSTFSVLRGGLKLYGGYSPGGTARDVSSNPTILSGDIGTQSDSTDNSYHVMVIAGLGSTADSVVIDGFTMRAGNANGSNAKQFNGVSVLRNDGGGMYLQNNNGAGGKIAVSNCIFSTNTTVSNGGCMYNVSSSPTITNCIFSANTAVNDGAGMYNISSSPVLTNCTFSANNAAHAGGSMFNTSSSSPTITNCTFSANITTSGGAMLNQNSSSPAITNCTFNANRATSSGGGMFNESSSSPVITNCTFSANRTSSNGGGIFNQSSASPVITNCIFNANIASGGGGMYNSASSATITNCTFSADTANAGGGIFNQSSSPTIVHCIFSANIASSGGGGMLNQSSASPAITNCTFIANKTSSNGGGMFNESSASPAITNCIFSANKANSNGGGMYNSASSATITNCTFSADTANAGGGIFNQSSASPAITNCIIWGNSNNGIVNNSSTPSVSYSDVQGTGLYPGTGNINAAPRFANPADPDGADNIFGTIDDGLKLQQASPAINKGSNDAVASIPTDITGAARIQSGTTDMGAYESPFSTITLLIDDVTKAEGYADNTIIFTFTVRLSTPAPSDGVSFNIATADSTATAPSDYAARSLTASISAGDSTYSFDVAVNGDAAIEPTEYFLVKVTNVSNLDIVVTDSVGLGTIINDDVCSASTLYVDSSRSGSGDGTSWVNAFKELRTALFTAQICPNVTTILVAKGTYKPTNNTNRDSAFTILRGGLKLYGGYAPGGSSRDIASNPTIMSGDIGTQNDSTDNSYHVVVIAGLGSTADSVIVDGFTITRGNASGNGSIKQYNGVPTLNNEGGGIYLHSNNGARAKIAVRNCVLTRNSATYFAGGFYDQLSSPTIANCTFLNNTTTSGSGGAMFNFKQSSPTLTNCTFSSNTCTIAGGAMFNSNASLPVLTACTFSSNRSTNIGGAIYGGAIAVDTTSRPGDSCRITNCVFTANSAPNGGGIGFESLFSATITNCTFSSNTASAAGGTIYTSSSSASRIANSIIYGNNSGIVNASGGTVSVTYSDVQGTGVYTGTGNINADPLFVNAADPDGADNIFGTADDGLKLQQTSPAVNRGSNGAIPAGIFTDVTGAARIQSNIVDMGAYESPFTTLFIDDVTQAEGNAGPTIFTFTVRLSAPLSNPVSFDIATANNTAVAPGDYTARSLTGQTIATGDSTFTFTVSVNGDMAIEANETFFVNISNLSGATLTDGQGVGTINDDDCAATTTLYVDSSRSGSGDGTSWVNAFKELRTALFTAQICPNVTTILVAKGTYKPTDNTDRDSAFTILRGGLKLYGGYAPGGSSRDIASNPTIMSGDIGTQNDSTDNSYHVMVIAGLGSTADSVIVDGFTITRGNANGSSTTKSYNGLPVLRNLGGGMYLSSNNGAAKKIAVRNCIFRTNMTTSNGGGMYNSTSSPTIANCIFSANRATSNGGGMYNTFSSSPTITNCTFSTDTATNGGGIYNITSSSPTITNCIIWSNSSGIINNLSSSSPSVTYSDVQGTGVYTGTGNINADPLFVNAADPDGADNIFGTADDGLKLQQTSPAVNRGSNGAIPAGIFTDVTGAARIQSNIVDMGAYESPFTTLFIDDVTQAEGNAGPTIFTFTVRLSAPLSNPVSFDIATANNTAVAPGDYTARSLTGQTIATGDSTFTFTVSVNGDTAVEANETFLVTVTNVSGIAVIDSAAVGTITNDDLTFLSINNVTQNEGNSGTSTFNFTVRLSRTASIPVSFDIATANNTAVAPGDYTARSLTGQTIAAGDSTFTFTVSVNGDRAVEANETFFVNISNLNGAALTDGQGVGTINDDDCAATTTLYVDSSTTTSSGDGGSWANAYKELRDALAAAAQCPNVTTILVAKGTYKPTDNTDRDSAFTILRGGLKLYGGYAPGGSSRDIASNPTIMSGDIGTQNNNLDNSYHVMVIAGLGSTADSVIVDGFTITKGRAGASGTKSYNNIDVVRTNGGGMYLNTNSGAGRKIAIRNCRFRENEATDNSNQTYGAGMSNYFSSPAVTNCTFIANTSDNGGGGIYNESSAPAITNCTFSANAAPYGEGGGVDNTSTSSPVITNCVFSTNTAQNGGGIYNGTSSQSALTITNCTFNANTANFGGGVYNASSLPVINNCIIWGNNSGIYSPSSNPSPVTYSDVQGTGVYTGIGNINADPKFANTADPNGADDVFGTADDGLRLQATSPAINKGSNGAIPAGITTDITGAPRIQGGTVDMGAFEASPSRLTIDNVTRNEGNTGTTPFVFTVRLSAPTPFPITFTIATRDSTAIAPGDYTARTLSSQTIAVGDSTYTFSVSVVGDAVYEPREAFLVRVTNITGAVVADSIGLGTILNDDCPAFATLYVDSSLSVSGNGSSWATAFKGLNEAMVIASRCINISSIYVAKGTYMPTDSSDRDSAFTILRGGLKLYGGYAPGGSSRNISTYPTILSGDLGKQNDTSDNSYHIVVIAGLVSSSDSVVIDGFTITAGNAGGTGTKLYNTTSVPRNSGAGMYLSGNSAAGKKLVMRSCTFSTNRASSNGGGMYNTSSSPAIINSTFSSNNAILGGGMYNQSSSTPAITNCIFSANRAIANGGGVYNTSSSPAIINCTFSSDTALSNGAGMYNAASTPAITNCILNANWAGVNGAGIYNTSSSPVITNCTFSSDTAFSNGGGIYNQASSAPVITNCIIWNNSSGIFNISSSPSVSYSDVQGTGIYSGTNNINQDPLFANASDPDGADNRFATTDDGLRLIASSPAVNRGNNNSIPAGITTDIAGSTRIQQGTVDMGAYESPFAPTIALSIDNVSKAEGNSGTTPFIFTVRLSKPAPPGGVSFNIATADGTATNPSDYTAASSTVNIVQGDSIYTFTVPVNGDNLVEPNETFAVMLSNATGTGVVIANSQGVGTILNDDTDPCATDQTPPTITPKNITVYLDASGHASIQPFDLIQAFSDNCSVDSASVRLSANSFSCSDLPATYPTDTTAHLAYVATTPTGTQAYEGELGLEFTVNNPNGILIRQLGAFDHQGNGITGTQNGGVRVAIFNKATQQIVPGLDTVISGATDTLVANHRLRSISPVTLLPGSYVVVAKGYNTSELNGNVATGSPVTPGDNGNGAITYTGSGLYGDVSSSFNFPSHPDGGPALRYLAGTFAFSSNGTSSPSTGGSANHLAYMATTSTGTQAYEGELGLEFTVNNPNGILIRQLGAFDHQGNGITGTQNGGVRVAIFNKATQQIVPGLDTVISGATDTLVANHRLRSISPVTLLPGSYVVVAKGYNTSELNGNVATGSPVTPGDNGNGAITYMGSGLYGDVSSSFNFPSHPDGGPALRYLAGTFFYDVAASGSTSDDTTAHLAYVATTPTGTQAYEGELGLEFTVNNPNGILIRQLGAFDHQGNGITGTQNGGVRVAIFNKATQQIVPGLDTVISGATDTLVANHRLRSISPVTLLPGSYVVVAKGYNTSELNGNVATGSPVTPGDNGNGAITYTGSGLYGDVSSSFNFPSHPDGGPALRYLAGTFLYNVAASSSGAGNSSADKIVTITAADSKGNQASAMATVTLKDTLGACSAGISAASSAGVANQRSALRQEAGAGAVLQALVYPNPARDRFTLQLSGVQEGRVLLELVSVNGLLVERRWVSVGPKAGRVSEVFNVGAHPGGVYFVRVSSRQGVRTVKVVVAR